MMWENSEFRSIYRKTHAQQQQHALYFDALPAGGRSDGLLNYKLGPRHLHRRCNRSTQRYHGSETSRIVNTRAAVSAINIGHNSKGPGAIVYLCIGTTWLCWAYSDSPSNYKLPRVIPISNKRKSITINRPGSELSAINLWQFRRMPRLSCWN